MPNHESRAMRTSAAFTTCLAAILGFVLIALAPHWAHSAAKPAMAADAQAVVLLTGRSILERRLPAYVQIQPGRYLEARLIQRACTTPALDAGNLLLFLPDSQHCEPIRIQDQITLRQRLHGLTGRWLVDDIKLQLRKLPFLAVQPVHNSSDQVRGSCTCPNNNPPTGSVSCLAQVRTAGTAIGSVDFLANDVDGNTLSGQFSYQHDVDPVQSGLPAPLTSSCTPGVGSLQCTVQGLAPPSAGILQLILTVSDGTATLPLSTLLEVLAPVPDRIFADGFDSPGCL
jgi:hypothetical protein